MHMCLAKLSLSWDNTRSYLISYNSLILPHLHTNLVWLLPSPERSSLWFPPHLLRGAATPVCQPEHLREGSTSHSFHCHDSCSSHTTLQSLLSTPVDAVECGSGLQPLADKQMELQSKQFFHYSIMLSNWNKHQPVPREQNRIHFSEQWVRTDFFSPPL